MTRVQTCALPIFTGDSSERVDTRVLQVIFSFDRGDLPIQVGQQMDVFIEVTEAEAVAAKGMVSR